MAETAKRAMRHPTREITDPKEIEEIIGRAKYLYLGMAGDPAPYLVPLFYGYVPQKLYIHCARAGLKLDLISKNPRVGFALCEEPEILRGETACGFTARSRSVVGDGTARIAVDDHERLAGLAAIMSHYGSDDRRYKPDSLERTCVLAVDIRKLRAKRVG